MEAPLGLSSAREAGFYLFSRAILSPGGSATKTASHLWPDLNPVVSL
jgi:hypothetical protein